MCLLRILWVSSFSCVMVRLRLTAVKEWEVCLPLLCVADLVDTTGLVSLLQGSCYGCGCKNVCMSSPSRLAQPSPDGTG